MTPAGFFDDVAGGRALVGESAGSGGEASSPMGLVARALWRRKWMIMALALAGGLLAAMGGLGMAPKYTAKALLLIEPSQTSVIGGAGSPSGLSPDLETVETQVRILNSRNHLQSVIEDLDLAHDPEFNPPQRQGQLDFLKQQLAAWLPARKGTARPESPDEAIMRRFADHLKVVQEGRSYVISISFTSTSPDTAATVANEVADLYVQGQLEAKRKSTVEASDWLGQRVAALKAEVTGDEAAIERYRAQNNLVTGRRTDLSDQQVAELGKDLAAAEADLAGRQARLAFIHARQRQGQTLDTLPEAMDSPVVVDLRDKESALAQQEAQLGAMFGDKHPQMLLIRAERQRIEGKIAIEVGRILANLENEAEVAAARVQTLQASLAAAQGVSGQAQSAEVRLLELEREAQSSRQLYEGLLQRYKETREQKSIVAPDAEVISSAVPGERSSLPPSLFAAMGLTLSGAMGVMLALFLERLDQGLRSEADVRTALGLARVGLVPRLRRWQRPHQYLLARPLSVYTEAIRAIFATMHLDDTGKPARLILVTSSVPAEGKTTLAVSLAVYAARAGHRVLLLDLDLRNPSVLRELHRPVTAGIVEHLTRGRPLEEVIEHYPDLGLDLIAVRERTTDPMPLLADRRLGELLRKLRDEYDYVIVDSPPLLSVSDAQLLAPLVDKVLVVVQWTKTPRSLARAAIGTLRRLRPDNAAIVLTQVDLKKHAGYRYGDIYYGKHKIYQN